MESDGQVHGRSGLAVLLEDHRAELRRFLAARCGNADEAEDLLQDLWLKASSHAAGPVANPRAYLFRMANNLVLDRRRSEQRAMRRDHQWLENDGGGPAPVQERPDQSQPADEMLESAQQAAILRKAISTLPPGAQRALRLHRIDGHPQGEVAEIMGISRSGVEKHLVVAMKHLRIALRDCGLIESAASGDQGQAGGTDPPTDMRR